MTEYEAMLAVMERIDPATFPGLTVAQRCALGRFAKPAGAEPNKAQPVAQVVSDIDGSNKRVIFYSYAAMYDTPVLTKLYAATQPPAERTPEMNTAVRKVLQHHGLTRHGDGVVEADLIEAVLACINTPQPPAEQGAELSDYPPLPEPLVRIDQSDDEMWGELQEHAWDSDFTLKLNDPLFTADQMRAYVDADRKARGGVA